MQLGALGFALFTGSQRTWNKKPIEAKVTSFQWKFKYSKAVLKFKEGLKKYGFPVHSIVPHGSYLINLATPEKEKLEKSLESFIEEMQRCEQVSLTSVQYLTYSSDLPCIISIQVLVPVVRKKLHFLELQVSIFLLLSLLKDCINKAHAKTKTAIAVIENTAGQGNAIGCSFEEIKSIIDKVEDKNRVGVCIDTCHLFASGYDIRTKEAYDKTMSDFDTLIGFKHLKAFHLNDSKQDLGCRVDRHENIGKGKN